MKRFAESQLGVTLLEVMLVLAVAAMIIVMSIRYYQSANTSQQANSVMAQITAIMTAAEQLAQTTGSYKVSDISENTLKALLPANGFITPWGTAISIPDAGVSDSAYEMQIAGIPVGVCSLVRVKLATNNHYSGSATQSAQLDPCPKTSGQTWKFYYVANV